MVALRSFVRLCRIAATTALWFAVFLLGSLPWPSKHRRDRMRDLAMHGWARAVLRALRITLTVEGEPPRGGGLLVANHLSYLDIPVLASIRPLSFLSKSEIGQWPVIGLVARILGVQFVVREDKRALPQVAARLHDEVRRGHGVLFFPEGTSGNGDAVLPFRPALLAPAAESGLPVYYAAIRYTTPAECPPARTAVCWWGDAPFLPHARALLRLPRIAAQVRFCAEPLVASDRKLLARGLQDGVTSHLAAMTSEPESATASR